MTATRGIDEAATGPAIRQRRGAGRGRATGVLAGILVAVGAVAWSQDGGDSSSTNTARHEAVTSLDDNSRQVNHFSAVKTREESSGYQSKYNLDIAALIACRGVQYNLLSTCVAGIQQQASGATLG